MEQALLPQKQRWQIRGIALGFLVVLISGYLWYTDIKYDRELDFARSAFESGDYSGAVESFMLALELNNLPEIRREYRLAKQALHATQEAQAFFAAGDYTRAGAAYSQVLEINPKDKQVITSLSSSKALSEMRKQVATSYYFVYPFLKYRYKPVMQNMNDLLSRQKFDAASKSSIAVIKSELEGNQIAFAFKSAPDMTQVHDLLMASVNSLRQSISIAETALNENKPVPSAAQINFGTAQLQYRDFVAKYNELLAQYSEDRLELLQP